jgi:coniferyl-aldehyde dehydrogenase
MSAANPLEPSPNPIAPAPSLADAYARLRAAWDSEGGLEYARRVEYLDRLKEAILRWEEPLAGAVSADFGHRSRHETAVAELFPTIGAVKYVRKHLRGWMRGEKRSTSVVFAPASNRIVVQPLGVVGIIAPWNYPIQLAMIPIIYAIAAGNRVLLKPSELTPHTSDAIARMLAEVFPSDIVAVVQGGPEVGVAFTKLPFDHIFFTGSTQVGRHVMRAAAENLVPVTLELGGKSPVILHRDYPIEKAADRIAFGKLLNAGQTCTAPDYVLCPEDQIERFENAFRDAVTRYYPSLADNPDYTSIAADRHYQRLVRLRDEARDRGARVVEINPRGEELPAEKRKLAPTLLFNVPTDTAILEDEIFGPLLPVVPYTHLDEAIAWVNARPRPLALYYFDHDDARIERVMTRTTSGGACINDTLLHVAQEDLPFGGVGPSGLGSYHGPEGFKTFSHQKGVFEQARLNTTGLLTPPYGKFMNRMLNFLIGKARRG